MYQEDIENITLEELKALVRSMREKISLVEKEKNQTIDDLHNKIIANELRLRLEQNAVSDGIWDYNFLTHEMMFSDRYFTMLGYEPFELPNNYTTWIKHIHPEDIQKVTELVENLKKGFISNFEAEYRLTTKNGQVIWVLSRANVVESSPNGEPLRIIGTHIDITKLKNTEIKLTQNEFELRKQNEEYLKINQQLIQSNEKIQKINQQIQDKQAYLDSIFRSVPAAIGLVSDRIILFANEYIATMTGYELDQILGSDTLFLYTDKNEYLKVQHALYTNSPNEITSTVTKWKKKNGSIIDVLITASQINPDITEAGYSFSALDISEQKKYEVELLNAKLKAEEADRLKSTFLTNMSHELRTPMNGIIGFAEMLQNQMNLSKKEQYLKIIVNSSKQLLKIITDIIDISKIESRQVEIFNNYFNLNSIFKEMLDYYSNYITTRKKTALQIKLRTDLPDNNDYVFTDESKVKQIVSNLLSNAVKFTDIGTIEFGYIIIGDKIRIFVKDTGVGIEPQEKELIFERFSQSESAIRKKYGGNGLGLAICKGFSELLNGRIWVESEKRKGSTFYVELPYITQLPQVAEQESSYINKPETPYKNLHILVVDDDITCLNLFDEMLESTGIRISHATTGLEAVKFCRKNIALDLVFMDMRLPEMDGYEATQRIKEIRSDLPIVAQTAFAMSEDKSKCLNAGCDDYITKPIEQDVIFNIINKFAKKD